MLAQVSPTESRKSAKREQPERLERAALHRERREHGVEIVGRVQRQTPGSVEDT